MSTTMIAAVEESSQPSVALAMPDPRRAPVPQGWATETFAELADHLDWEELSEAEAHLKGMASFIESMAGDQVEFEKALRIVEFRKAVALGDPQPGHRSDMEPLPRVVEVDASPQTVSRWRKLAGGWDDIVWPHLLRSSKLGEVSQAACLRLIDERRKLDVGPERPKPKAASADPPSANGTAPPTAEADTEAGSTEAYDPAEDAPDPVAEWERAERENEQLRSQVDALSASDLGAEVRKWSAKYAQLEGRLQAAITEGNEAKRQARAQGRILQQLRSVLKVDTNSEIVGAVQDLVR